MHKILYALESQDDQYTLLLIFRKMDTRAKFQLKIQSYHTVLKTIGSQKYTKMYARRMTNTQNTAENIKNTKITIVRNLWWKLSRV